MVGEAVGVENQAKFPRIQAKLADSLLPKAARWFGLKTDEEALKRNSYPIFWSKAFGGVNRNTRLGDL